MTATAGARATGTVGERASVGWQPGAAPPLRTGERSTVRIDLTPRAARQVRSLLAAREPQACGLRPVVDGDAATDGAGGANVHDHGGSCRPGAAYLLSLAPVPAMAKVVSGR